MLEKYRQHNQFKVSLESFLGNDPQLQALSKLHYQYQYTWWQALPLDTAGIYILTGGRQVGKSTSCKQMIAHCIENELFFPENTLYLPCDEIFDATMLSDTLRYFVDQCCGKKFLLVIDEITYVDNWDRVIKALADEGAFNSGVCLLTGSDTLILKEAAMRFPGRRGVAAKTDFHLYPLSFSQYAGLVLGDSLPKRKDRVKNSSDVNTFKEDFLQEIFSDYLQCGGYLRAINDMAVYGKVSEATFTTYEQWIRGDFLKNGKSEATLLAILQAIQTVGVSQVSYSQLTQKIGIITKDTCIDYCNLLERMDVLFNMQAFDQNTKQGFPRKARKFHFCDPFIFRCVSHWLHKEGKINRDVDESELVEAVVASHMRYHGHCYYHKGSQGEVDVLCWDGKKLQAIEVKWTNQIRPADFKTLSQFDNAIILKRHPGEGVVNSIKSTSVYEYLSKN